MVRRPQRAPTSSGFTLVGMVVIFTVMSVMVAAALPFWSKVIQREREEELIFRGLQYAEAIRVFQLRNGRYPVRLQELVTVRPRCLRQLWTDPMTEEGQWGLVYAQAAPQQRGRRGRQRRQAGVAPQQQTQPQQFGGTGPRPLGGDDERATAGGRAASAVGPIIGVHSLSEEESSKVFFGATKYSDWRFTVELVPVAMVKPDTLIPVRANARWVGRPFRPGLEPQQLGTAVQQGSAPGAQDRRPRRPRRPRPDG